MLMCSIGSNVYYKQGEDINPSNKLNSPSPPIHNNNHNNQKPTDQPKTSIQTWMYLYRVNVAVRGGGADIVRCFPPPSITSITTPHHKQSPDLPWKAVPAIFRGSDTGCYINDN